MSAAKLNKCEFSCPHQASKQILINIGYNKNNQHFIILLSGMFWISCYDLAHSKKNKNVKFVTQYAQCG